MFHALTVRFDVTEFAKFLESKQPCLVIIILLISHSFPGQDETRRLLLVWLSSYYSYHIHSLDKTRRLLLCLLARFMCPGVQAATVAFWASSAGGGILDRPRI